MHVYDIYDSRESLLGHAPAVQTVYVVVTSHVLLSVQTNGHRLQLAVDPCEWGGRGIYIIIALQLMEHFLE